MRLHYAYSLDTPAFIEEVKRRPLLWDNSVMGYNTQKNTKLKLWDEISEVIDPQYRENSIAERLHFKRLLQRRWKSLRDCFTRELGKMKRIYSVTKLADYKPYCYFKNLGFLLDVVERDANGITKESTNGTTVVEDATVEVDSTLNNAEPFNEITVTNSNMEENSDSKTCESQLKNMSVKRDEPVKQISASKILKITESPTCVKNDTLRNLRIHPSSIVKVLPIQMTSCNENESMEINGNGETNGRKNISKVMNTDNNVYTSRMNVISNLRNYNGRKRTKTVSISSNEAETNSFNTILVDSNSYNSSENYDYQEDNSSTRRRLCLDRIRKTRNYSIKHRYRKLKRKWDDDDDNDNESDENYDDDNDYDDDRMFMLSLVKELKKIPDDYKLDVKLEIMQALRNGQMRSKIKLDFSNSVAGYESEIIGANVTIHNEPELCEVIVPEKYEPLTTTSETDGSSEHCTDKIIDPLVPAS